MSSVFEPFDDDELGGGGSSEIKQDGLYRFKCISAFDSYKVNDGDREDPDRDRRISTRLKVLEPIRDTRGEFDEMEEDFEQRKKEIGNISSVSIWLGRDTDASLLEGNLKLLNAIAGSPRDDQPSEELRKKYQKGKKGGQPQYELGPLVDEMEVNCSALVGRDFIAEIEDTDTDYPSFFPWYGVEIGDDKQTTFDHPVKGEIKPSRSPLHSGEDKASQRTKQRFSDNEEYAGASEEDSTFEPDDDDDLPF